MASAGTEEWGQARARLPAEAAGGIKALKAISAPFRGIRFVPTGGISPLNLGEYLRLPAVHACGGSWLVAESLLAARAFDRIERLAAEAVEMVARTRGIPVS